MSLSLIEQIHIAVAQAPSTQNQHPVTVSKSPFLTNSQQNGVAVAPCNAVIVILEIHK